MPVSGIAIAGATNPCIVAACIPASALLAVVVVVPWEVVDCMPVSGVTIAEDTNPCKAVACMPAIDLLDVVVSPPCAVAACMPDKVSSSVPVAE